MSERTSIDAETLLCAVISHPVKHSISPAIHNAAFAAANINAVYLAFEVLDLGAVLAGMRAMPNFRGLSVTIPHKRAVIQHLDSLDPLAETVGSVNTVTNERGVLRGSTTDGLGAVRAFETAGVDLRGKRVLFLGTGGAVRAVACAIADRCHPARLTILGRTPEHVAELANHLRDRAAVEVDTGDLTGDIEEAIPDHDIIVNGTPLGMAPEHVEVSPVPSQTLRREQAVFDMVYTPHTTRLIADAERIGCTVVHGIEMLVRQAALQFETWTGQVAPLEVMRDAAQSALGTSR